MYAPTNHNKDTLSTRTHQKDPDPAVLPLAEMIKKIRRHRFEEERTKHHFGSLAGMGQEEERRSKQGKPRTKRQTNKN